MQHNQGTNTDIAHPCVFLLNFSCSYTFLAVWRLELIVRGEDNFINLEKRFEIIEYVHVFNVFRQCYMNSHTTMVMNFYWKEVRPVI